MCQYPNRTGIAVSISVLVHSCLVIVAIGISRPDAPPMHSTIEMRIISQNKPFSSQSTSSIPTHFSTDITDIQLSTPAKSNAPATVRLAKPRFKQSNTRPSVSVSSTGQSTEDPLASEIDISASNQQNSSSPPHTTVQPLVTRFTFSDYETLKGKEAVLERDRFTEQREEQKRNRNRLAPMSKALSAALRNNRSITIGETVLPPENKIAIIQGYLQQLHQQIGPPFSIFLDRLDSPFERAHKQIQNSALKYNPFYVPPPDSERQSMLNGNMADLSISALTEFQILPDGSLADVRLIRTSKYTIFDVAAVNAILTAAPFTPPPSILLSKNNRSYIQWSFYRDWKKNSANAGRLFLLDSTTVMNSDTDSTLVKER